MNSLKERRIGVTSTTKAITTTLFIFGSLIAGFMGMNLSFSQTAMAQPQGPPEDTPPENPQCPDGARFERGECIVEVCPPETDLELNDKCYEEVDKVPTCPNPPFTNLLADGKCHPNTNPSSAGRDPVLACPPETDLEYQGNCYVELDKIEERTRPGVGNN